jgi:CRP/FNR family cyclic AMP-dependent transcriptional regulator
MVHDDLVKALQSLEFTKDLKHEHLAKLAAIACHVSFSEGATIFAEEDVSELVYVIERGRVVLQTKVPGHGEVQILELGPGDLLGWSSLFAPKRKTASAKVVESAHAIAINATKLRELCRIDAELGYQILWRVANVISDRLRAARAMLLDMFEPSRKDTSLAA